MSFTLQNYRNWLIGTGVTGESLNAAMLDAQNKVRNALVEHQVSAGSSYDLFELCYGTKEREIATRQSIENQVVGSLLNQEQQEQFAAAVLLQPGDAALPLED